MPERWGAWWERVAGGEQCWVRALTLAEGFRHLSAGLFGKSDQGGPENQASQTMGGRPGSPGWRC